MITNKHININDTKKEKDFQSEQFVSRKHTIPHIDKKSAKNQQSYNCNV